MEREPIGQTGFVPHEQGLEAIEPGVQLFDDQPPPVKFGVQRRVIVGLPIGGAAIARNVDFDAALGARLAQAADIKDFVGIEKQPG